MKVTTTEEETRNMKYDRRIDETKATVLLFVVILHSALPDLLVSHLCQALAGQSVNLCVS